MSVCCYCGEDAGGAPATIHVATRDGAGRLWRLVWHDGCERRNPVYKAICAVRGLPGNAQLVLEARGFGLGPAPAVGTAAEVYGGA